jgi:ribonuclease P protein component
MHCVPLRKKDPFWRLRRKRGFAFYHEEGLSWRGAAVLLPQASCWSISVVVGRKIGPAVLRNKLKRRVRQILSLCAKKQHPEAPALACVITARSAELAVQPFEEALTSVFHFTEKVRSAL